MYQYTIIGIWRDERGTTCEHCGRGIKNVVKVRDNHTGEEKIVGTTCIDKIMDMGIGFSKRVQKEIKKYMKLKKAVENFNAEDEFTKAFNELKSMNDRNENSAYNKFEYWRYITIYREEAGNVYKTDKEFIQCKDELIADAKLKNEDMKQELKKQIELLNTISKYNMFKIEDLEEVNETEDTKIEEVAETTINGNSSITSTTTTNSIERKVLTSKEFQELIEYTKLKSNSKQELNKNILNDFIENISKEIYIDEIDYITFIVNKYISKYTKN